MKTAKFLTFILISVSLFSCNKDKASVEENNPKDNEGKRYAWGEMFRLDGDRVQEGKFYATYDSEGRLIQNINTGKYDKNPYNDTTIFTYSINKVVANTNHGEEIITYNYSGNLLMNAIKVNNTDRNESTYTYEFKYSDNKLTELITTQDGYTEYAMYEKYEYDGNKIVKYTSFVPDVYSLEERFIYNTKNQIVKIEGYEDGEKNNFYDSIIYNNEQVVKIIGYDNSEEYYSISLEYQDGLLTRILEYGDGKVQRDEKRYLENGLYSIPNLNLEPYYSQINSVLDFSKPNTTQRKSFINKYGFILGIQRFTR